MRKGTQNVTDNRHDIPPARLAGQTGRAAGETPVASAYLDTEMAGAAPQRLCILLYDGAISLCRQALAALDAGNAQLAADRLGRARTSVRHLQDSLHAPALSDERRMFAGLYRRVHTRLIEADFYRRREVVRETITLLSRQRGGWQRLANSLATAHATVPAERSWVG